MIGHVERHPGVRDRAIFVGDPDDIAPLDFGRGLPAMRDWVPKHFEFAGYIIGEHPRHFGPRDELRERLGYHPDERVCVATVGGSSVGLALIHRILAAFPSARALIPELRMVLVTGPRIAPQTLPALPGIDVRGFVPDLDRHLAACDLAIVQGGLTTCMELAAAGTPFIYVPLRRHFEAEHPRRPSARSLRRRTTAGLQRRDARRAGRRHARDVACPRGIPARIGGWRRPRRRDGRRAVVTDPVCHEAHSVPQIARRLPAVAFCMRPHCACRKFQMKL